MLDFKPKYNDEFELLESKLHFIRDELKQYITDAREMAYTDALTGLGNRNAYFEEILLPSFLLPARSITHRLLSSCKFCSTAREDKSSSFAICSAEI